MPLVATETGYWNGDVIGIDSNKSIEIEIKTNKQDLKRDFVTKQNKHYIYQHGEQTRYTPNFFYFLVPKELEMDAVKLCLEEAPQYGVLVANKKEKPLQKSKGKKRRKRTSENTYEGISVAKKPVRLHLNEPSDDLKDMVLKRLSSELCRAYLAYERLYDQRKKDDRKEDDKEDSSG